MEKEPKNHINVKSEKNLNVYNPSMYEYQSTQEQDIIYQRCVTRGKTVVASEIRSSKFTSELLYRKKKEEELLQSIANLENITKEKMQLADTIEFKNIPDSIIKCNEFGVLLEEDSPDSDNDISYSDNKLTRKEKKLEKKKEKEKKEHLLTVNARIEKWNFMLSNLKEFQTNKYHKLKSRTRKGIPDNLRGYVWQIISGADKYYIKNLYQNLDNEPMDKSIEEIIIRDLDRTFPNCYLFKDKYGKGKRELLRVLSKYSIYNKKVGYIQGMAFICALLLTYMDEERSFFMLHTLVKKYELEKIYLPGLEDLKKKFYVLLNLEKKFIPKCYKIFVKDDVTPRCYASEWFISLFASNLDLNILVRIFDTFILEGFKVIYRFSLAFIKLKEDELIKSKNVDSTFLIMDNFLKNINLEELWKIAFGFGITRKAIENYEKEYEKVKCDNNNEFIKQII